MSGWKDKEIVCEVRKGEIVERKEGKGDEASHETKMRARRGETNIAYARFILSLLPLGLSSLSHGLRRLSRQTTESLTRQA